MPDELEHFVEAQNLVFDQVVKELTQGEKQSHWMWFAFPQLAGLGHSFMARRYALHSLAEARSYASHPVLGVRLRECTRLVEKIQDRTVSEIFGYPDDLKFQSCMTLFALAMPEEPLFEAVLKKFFQGRRDGQTLELLGQPS